MQQLCQECRGGAPPIGMKLGTRPGRPQAQPCSLALLGPLGGRSPYQAGWFPPGDPTSLTAFLGWGDAVHIMQLPRGRDPAQEALDLRCRAAGHQVATWPQQLGLGPALPTVSMCGCEFTPATDAWAQVDTEQPGCTSELCPSDPLSGMGKQRNGAYFIGCELRVPHDCGSNGWGTGT